MGSNQTTIRTVTCDGPGCDKTITFEMGSRETGVPKETEALLTAPENAWMNTTLRTVTTPDGRQLIFHDDVCEVNSVATGNHNKPEPKKVIQMPSSAAAVEQIRKAAVEAAARKQADKDLRAGPTLE
jgi:hypothetical protein